MKAKGLKTRVLCQGTALLIVGAQAAYAGNVGVNLNINLGEPPRAVVVAPPPPAPVYVAPAPAPVYVAPAPLPPEPFVVAEDVQFIYPNALGFYVAVGVPYDLFYLQNSYFLYRDGRWLRAATPRGPWVATRYRELPPGLRRHRLERIRDYRAREYAVYNRDRDHYRGRVWRAERHREAEHMRREERHLEREDRRAERELRHEERRQEREERHRGRD